VDSYGKTLIPTSLAQDIQYCASDLRIEAYDGVDLLQTHELGGGDTTGTHVTQATIELPVDDGVLSLEGIIKPLRCATPTTAAAFDNSTLIIKFDGEVVETLAHANGDFLPQTPVSLDVSEMYVAAGNDPNVPGTYVLEVVRQGTGCNGMYGDAMSTLFEVTVVSGGGPQPELTATLSPFSGDTATLTAVVTDGSGGALPGALVQFSPTGGTVSPLSGTTDQNGSLTATATLGGGSFGMTIAVAVMGPAGQVLDSTIVTGGIAATIALDLESIVSPVTDTPLTISVSAEVPSGSIPLSNVWLDIEVVGGSAGTSGGFANLFGQLETTIRSAPKFLCVGLDITARQAPGGPILGTHHADVRVLTAGLDSLVVAGFAQAVGNVTDQQSGAVGTTVFLACPAPANGIQLVTLAATAPLNVAATQTLRLEANDSLTQIAVHAEGQASGPGSATESSLQGSFQVTTPVSVLFTPGAADPSASTAWVYLTRTPRAVYGLPGGTDDVLACLRTSTSAGTEACNASWPMSFNGILQPGTYYLYAGTIGGANWEMAMTVTLTSP
jgi:hypothetical protein